MGLPKVLQVRERRDLLDRSSTLLACSSFLLAFISSSEYTIYMHELERVLGLKRQQQEVIKTAQEKLHALELVERMLTDDRVPQVQAEQIPPKLYNQMKQDAAIQDVLERAGVWMTAAQITDALQRGGFRFTADDPRGSVYAALKQNRKGLYATKKEGQNVVFGLAKWEQAEAAQAAH